MHIAGQRLTVVVPLTTKLRLLRSCFGSTVLMVGVLVVVEMVLVVVVVVSVVLDGVLVEPEGVVMVLVEVPPKM